MDLETENRLAALLMDEARQLRLQAEKEGVHAYLRKPNVRNRPNSRFLTATVLGVQQSNRAVEVREMWHARGKELEMETKHRSRSKEERCSERSKKYHDDSLSSRSRRQRDARDSAISCSSSKWNPEDDYSLEDDGLRDDDIEEFLQSRVKRGRGSIGSRMDEPGPYASSTSSGQDVVHFQERTKGEAERRVLGPEMPSFLRSVYDETCKGDLSSRDTCCSSQHSKVKRKKKDKSDKSKRKEHKSKHHNKSRRRD